MSKYKQQSAKRRDERNCKSPGQPRPSKKKVKKPFVVMMKIKQGEECWLYSYKEWEQHKRYAKRADAEQAINAIKDDWFYRKFDFRIEGPE